MNNKLIMPTLDLARKLIVEQFPEYACLPIVDVEKQGHDNRTYRLGEHMLIRMPTAADMDPDTWLRARAWALWKATFELCHIADKNSPEARLQKRIIDQVII
jgi:aminoglycoside phosphotransferase (APT) family kinase protein